MYSPLDSEIWISHTITVATVSSGESYNFITKASVLEVSNI